MRPEDFAEEPIVRNILPHTGRLDGDDSGYRTVAVSHLDSENPDPLVELNGILECYPVYAQGARKRITPWYGKGLGALPRLLVRKPVAKALEEADLVLQRIDRRLLVLDAWRSATVQARLWKSVFTRIIDNRNLQIDNLSMSDVVRIGRLADDTASYCAVAVDHRYEAVFAQLMTRAEELDEAAAVLQCDRNVLATEYITFLANLERHDLSLDHKGNTAHGSGGACDLYLLDTTDGSPVNLGVPFDSTSPAATIDFFEWSSPDEYRELVSKDSDLRGYLSEFGITEGRISAELIRSIAAERRKLFHALRAVGATFFSLGKNVGEPWHFNLGCERGGHHAALYPGGGSACHSLLKNVRDPSTGNWIAVWGNETAHRLAVVTEQ